MKNRERQEISRVHQFFSSLLEETVAAAVKKREPTGKGWNRLSGTNSPVIIGLGSF
jgi:hypothetical protein